VSGLHSWIKPKPQGRSRRMEQMRSTIHLQPARVVKLHLWQASKSQGQVSSCVLQQSGEHRCRPHMEHPRMIRTLEYLCWNRLPIDASCSKQPPQDSDMQDTELRCPSSWQHMHRQQQSMERHMQEGADRHFRSFHTVRHGQESRNRPRKKRGSQEVVDLVYACADVPRHSVKSS
jgi:hypothetical protein